MNASPESNPIEFVPPANSTNAPAGPMATMEPSTDLGDPADALNASEFYRRIRAREPERYREALRKFPVNQNVTRDELVHEVPLDELVASDAEVTQADRQVYRDWLVQQFR